MAKVAVVQGLVRPLLSSPILLESGQTQNTIDVYMKLVWHKINLDGDLLLTKYLARSDEFSRSK
jgi:hypothetical protein